MVFVSHSQSETEELGRKLGLLLKKGSFVALFGDLGGGKTCFVRGFVESASPESAQMVASPTFAIMHEYPGVIPLYHFDLYRLSGNAELAELGFDEYFNGDGICIVEWAERLGDMAPMDRVDIRFINAGDNRRSINIEVYGSGNQNLLRQLQVAG